jgi:hypothetical protein
VAALAAYAVAVEPVWIEVSDHDLRADPGTPPIRVAQLSDLHLRALGRREAAVAARIAELQPDVLLLSGDVVDRADGLPVLSRFLATLGRTPVLAVLGNWEYWSHVDLAALRATYTARPDTYLLVNAAASLELSGRTLHVIGLDDATAGHPAAVTVPPGQGTTVVLAHSPGYFGEAAGLAHADLCVAGHTHGGQVTLFGFAPWTPPGSGPYRAGFYDTPACRLYVSRGVGTSILPIRFGARPEIAVFEL